VHKVALPCELTPDLLPQRVSVLGERVAHLLAQSVKLLRQMLFAGVERGLEIVPRRLLGPEGEDAQQCSGQGSLLVRRKPGGA
jgi:hypothetical protein